MNPKQTAKLALLTAACTLTGKTVTVIPSLPKGRVPAHCAFALDSTVIFVTVSKDGALGHVAISKNGALDLPFVRSFAGSYASAAERADELEKGRDANGYTLGRKPRVVASKGTETQTMVTPANVPNVFADVPEPEQEQEQKAA
jgi:hypothetical protein